MTKTKVEPKTFKFKVNLDMLLDMERGMEDLNDELDNQMSQAGLEEHATDICYIMKALNVKAQEITIEAIYYPDYDNYPNLDEDSENIITIQENKQQID